MVVVVVVVVVGGGRGGGVREGTIYNDLYGEAPPKRGAFFRLQSYEKVRNSVMLVYKKAQKG